MTKEQKIKKAKRILSMIFLLYDRHDPTGGWELNKATGGLYDYIKKIEKTHK
jgi:hypothetical protein